MKNTKVHHTNMKKEEREHSSPSGNILKLPFYLLIACGQTLSTDGVTVSRRMVVYSSAIYILDLILLFRNVTCFDKDDDFASSEVAEKLGSVIFQITLQILLSITLYGSAKKFPAIIKKLEKLEITIGDRSFAERNTDIFKETHHRWTSLLHHIGYWPCGVQVPYGNEHMGELPQTQVVLQFQKPTRARYEISHCGMYFPWISSRSSADLLCQPKQRSRHLFQASQRAACNKEC